MKINYKRLLFASALILAFFLSSCGNSSELITTAAADELPVTQAVSEPIRAMWFNYNELAMKSLGGGNEHQFREKVDAMFLNAKGLGVNRAIVQVRPFSDAFYSSSVYPPTEYLSGQQGVSVSYDALKIIVETAKKYELKVDAWINPYRVSYKTDFSQLSDTNPAKIWYNEDNNTRNLIIIDKGIFYNPASQQVQKLILDGIREILTNYEVDGIHIDDYFYPSTDASIDFMEYESYTQQGGRLTLDNWRRENVSCFVSTLYMTIKSINPEAKLTISPSGDIDKNFSEHYADVEKWCSQSGYLDIIMPQVYYGFKNKNQPFESTAERWSRLVKCDSIALCYGLACYKSGKEDEYAGDGKDEWLDNSDVLLRQIKHITSISEQYGWSFYSYSGFFSAVATENAKMELQNIKSML